MASKLGGDVLGEPDHGVLGCRVPVRAHPADDAGHARQRHNGALLLGDHDARRVLHPKEHAVHVDVEHPPHLDGVHVPDVCHLVARDAGIVDHDVQAAEPLRRRVDGVAHFVLDRHVAVDKHDILAVASEGIAQLLARIILDVSDADLGAMLPEEANDGFTDAGGTAGDQGNLPFQPVIKKEYTIKLTTQLSLWYHHKWRSLDPAALLCMHKYISKVLAAVQTESGEERRSWSWWRQLIEGQRP
jgi:hypothetical protein